MELHDITVLVDTSKAGEERLRLAIALARRVGGRITGIGAIPPPNQVGRVKYLPRDSGLEIVELPEPPTFEGAALIDLDERRFRSESGELGSGWVTITRGHPSEVIQLSRLSDLTILGQLQADPRNDHWGFHPEDVVLEAGGPCIIVPYAGSFETLGRRVLIAWDGSREAARALRDAKPFLHDAEETVVVSINRHDHEPATDRRSLDRVVAHMALQGIKVTAEPEVKGELSVSDVLLNRASDLGSDLLVTGSFHHSRLREALVGGVTRELLDHVTIPMLMSH